MSFRFIPLLAGAGIVASLAGCSDEERPTGPAGADEVASIVITPGTDTLTAIDQAIQLVATARDDRGTPITGQEFDWSSSHPTVISVTSGGRVVAKAPGTATITARAGDANATATLVVAQAVANLAISPDTWKPTALGQQQTVTPHATDATGHPILNVPVTWSTSDSAIVTVTAAGLVTAIGNGNATLTATAEGRASVLAVEVRQVVTEVLLEPASWSPNALGAQQQFTATARDANANPVTDWTAVWASTDTSIATVTATGVVQAVKAGVARIDVTTTGASGKADIVVAQAVASVEVSPTADTLRTIGATRQLQAVARDGNGAAISAAAFTWQSSNPAAVTVSASGEATAVALGTATISASTSGKTASVDIVVAISMAPPIVAIAVSPEVWTATQGGARQQFRVIATDANGDEVELTNATWQSSHPSVAAADANGLVTANADGQAVLTVTAAGRSSTAAVTVDRTGATSDGLVWSVYFARQIETPALIDNGRLTTPGPDLEGFERVYPGSSVAKFQFEGDRIAVLTDVAGGQGTLRIRERVGEWGDLVIGTARDFQLEGNRIAVLHGDGSVRVKDGASGAWSTLVSSGGRKIQLEGNRIGVLSDNGDFRVKDGIAGGWTVLAAPGAGARDFQLEGNRIGVLKDDGEFRVKDGPSGAWTVLAAAEATSFELEGNRIAVVYQGAFKVKDGISGAWSTLANSGVVKHDMEGSRIGLLLTGGVLRVKTGITGAWTTLASTGATDFQLQGNRIAVLLGSRLRIKDGSLSAAWTFDETFASVTQIRAAVNAPTPPYRTTPASYASGQTNCGAACVRQSYVPVLGFISPILFGVPVPIYGRNCGHGRPEGGQSRVSIDGMDRICYEHDRSPYWYPTSTGVGTTDVTGACIVRYGILNARLTRNGALIARGSTAWKQAMGTMPEMYAAHERYVNWTSTCSEGVMNKFEADTRINL